MQGHPCSHTIVGLRDYVQLFMTYLVETLMMLHQDELVMCNDLVQGHHLTLGQLSAL